jgi:16S rRNA (adenine1518-N6/adenine1519-N6)-dimethyltransferase
MVKAKKHLGQHFLKDKNIAAKIVNSLTQHGNYKKVLEIGPGTGVLTQYLLQKKEFETTVIELDRESVAYLKQHFLILENRIIEGDFLHFDLNIFSDDKMAIIGNFPYNISTQILFKVFENRSKITEVVGMFQKEVAKRIASPPGSKEYGILSVLLQSYYKCEYLFTVDEQVFIPPPKVKSGVLRLTRNKTELLDCNELLYVNVIKTSFNHRRKTIWNSLQPIIAELNADKEKSIFKQRPEQLSFKEFVELTKYIEGLMKQTG